MKIFYSNFTEKIMNLISWWSNNSMIYTLKRILAEDENVIFAYLFGSHARGDESSRSDVDVAVYLRDTSLDRQLKLHHALQKELRREVDLLVLNEARNIYLLDSVLKEGILLKDAPMQPEFEVDTHLAVLDFKAFKQYIDTMLPDVA
jgi:predicted nucleotidyltransferase